jgi:tetratricopeptide (TPR) repeat protein
MADNYGVTFAQKHIQRGEYEQAVAAAEKHASQEPESPEPHHDRARALALLERYRESVEAYRTAIAADQVEQILQDWEVDDGLFSTVIAWAQASVGQEEQLRILGLYRELLPRGRHLPEAEEWGQRFRGLLKTQFVKPRD